MPSFSFRWYTSSDHVETINKILSVLLLLSLAGPTFAEKLGVTVVDLRAESGLVDAVVEVFTVGAVPLRSSPLEVSVDQVNKEFVSGVTIVPVGSRVNFPNSDDILHHVYSFSSAKTFDIPLYGEGDNIDLFESFDNPGIVEIGCNIHDWMLAYIYVAESQLAAKTDSEGVVTLEGLAPGRYEVKIWHARMGAGERVSMEVDVETGVDAGLSVSLDLAPERRIRRAPSSARGRYR